MRQRPFSKHSSLQLSFTYSSRVLLGTALTFLLAPAGFTETEAPEAEQKSKNPTAAAAKMMRYLKPTGRKNGLNEGQDRTIKQRTFKSGQNTDVHGVFNPEIGVYAVVTKSELKNEDALKKLLNSDKVAGLSAIVAWNQLEPKDGEYDWKLIENVLTLCQSHNKYLILRVSTCGIDDAEQIGNSDTPEFVFAAGGKSLLYKGADGKEHRMPIFWDKTYLAKWANFVKALGEKFDKNESLHSVGITGGGILGSSLIVPDFIHTSENYDSLQSQLTKEHGMAPQKIVEHWKYVADLFPKSFEKTRLNFDIDAPLTSRTGQNMLDEISDYLVYRYGERVFITRQSISDAKHGFDQYRVILKLKNDTYTGYALTDSVSDTDLPKIVKNSLNDGVSFMEIPSKYIGDDNAVAQNAIEDLKNHLGYQIGCQQAQIDTEVKAGEPLKTSFVFENFGSSALVRPVRQLDKDVPNSYQIGIELIDDTGKSVVLSHMTPAIPTTQWFSGKPISCNSSFRLPEHLKPGTYTVSLALINKETKKRVRLIDSRPKNEQSPTPDAASSQPEAIVLGKLKVS